MCLSNSYGRKINLESEYITTDRLKKWGAKCDGLQWFRTMFPQGCYISIGLAACNNPNWIKWLLQRLSEEVEK